MVYLWRSGIYRIPPQSLILWKREMISNVTTTVGQCTLTSVVNKNIMCPVVLQDGEPIIMWKRRFPWLVTSTFYGVGSSNLKYFAQGRLGGKK